MNYLYSIIIPHYNDLERLKKLVSTVPVRGDIEIIIIDDNSDAFPDINTFPNRNIQILLNNSGIQSAGACRNIGLKKATGKWLLFADADDFFLPNAFEIIDSNIDIKIDIFYFSPKSQCLFTGNDSDRHIAFEKLVDSYLLHNDESIRYRCIVPWSKVYRRNFVLENNFLFEEIVAANDVLFSLKSGHLANRISTCRDSIYCVTKGVNTLTTNKTKEVIRSRLLAELRKYEYIRVHNIYTNLNKPSVMFFIRNYGKGINISCLKKLYTSYQKGSISFLPYRYLVIYINNFKLFL